MRSCRSAGTLFLATLLLPAGADEVGQQIDLLALPYIEHGVVVGMTVGILTENQERIRGYGRLSARNDRVPDGRTVYEIGSLTKPITGILLGYALESGEVREAQPADRFLPSGVRMPSCGVTPITLEHLATHTSGLPRLPDNFQPEEPANPYACYTEDRLYAFLNEHGLRRPPGQQAEYSNLGTGLLGHLLARRAERDFDQLVSERIAGPLGMTNTAMALSPEMIRRLAPPHRADGSPDTGWDLALLAGAGGLRSSVRDMLRLLAAHLDPPDGKLGAAIERAWTIQPDPQEQPPFSMGLGWFLARDGQTRWHNGQTGGYRAMALVRREPPLAVVVLANSATSEVDRLAEDVFRLLDGQHVEPRLFPNQAVKGP